MINDAGKYEVKNSRAFEREPLVRVVADRGAINVAVQDVGRIAGGEREVKADRRRFLRDS